MEEFNINDEKKGLKITIIILVVIIISLVGYITYQKFLKDIINDLFKTEEKEVKEVGSIGDTYTKLSQIETFNDKDFDFYIEDENIVFENFKTKIKKTATGIKGNAKYLTAMKSCDGDLSIAVLTEEGEVYISKQRETYSLILESNEKDFLDFIKVESNEKLYGIKSSYPFIGNPVCGVQNLYVYNKDDVLKIVDLELESHESNNFIIYKIVKKATIGKTWDELYPYKYVLDELGIEDYEVFIYKDRRVKFYENNNFIVDENNNYIVIKRIFIKRNQDDIPEIYYFITDDDEILYLLTQDYNKEGILIAKKYNNKKVSSAYKTGDVPNESPYEYIEISITYDDGSDEKFITTSGSYFIIK